MIVAFSGIREVADESIPDVDFATADAVVGADECRFGGARGSDTLALEAAADFADAETRLIAIVPDVLATQPEEGRRAIHLCADDIVELEAGHHPKAYYARNDALIDGADRLVAFTDGRSHGGTAYTIDRAQTLGIETVVIPVATRHARPNPELDVEDAPAPIFGYAPYGRRIVSGLRQYDRRTELIRSLKLGEARPSELNDLAEALAEYIQTEPVLARMRHLVPMPRQQPDVASDLLPLAKAVADRLGIAVLDRWLQRVSWPTDGRPIRGRMRFSVVVHAASLVVVGARDLSDVLLFDNVITTCGTMLGAQQAVLRDTGHAPPGLAVLYSTETGVRVPS